jgi:hypothetical protein
MALMAALGSLVGSKLMKTKVSSAQLKKMRFIGNRRDSPAHLAVKRKAKLISPYIWRSVTANPKEPS